MSIVSDGWRDQRNLPLINAIAIWPQGAMFLKAIDCSGVEKDATFISNILIDAIESVGPQMLSKSSQTMHKYVEL